MCAICDRHPIQLNQSQEALQKVRAELDAVVQARDEGQGKLRTYIERHESEIALAETRVKRLVAALGQAQSAQPRQGGYFFSATPLQRIQLPAGLSREGSPLRATSPNSLSSPGGLSSPGSLAGDMMHASTSGRAAGHSPLTTNRRCSSPPPTSSSENILDPVASPLAAYDANQKLCAPHGLALSVPALASASITPHTSNRRSRHGQGNREKAVRHNAKSPSKAQVGSSSSSRAPKSDRR